MKNKKENGRKTLCGVLRAILFAAAAFCCASVAARDVDTLRSYRMGEAVVTGTNRTTGRDLLPYTVSTVSAEQIEATGQTQLLSALSGRVPGLFVSERNILGFGLSNGGAGGIKIRGVGGQPTNAVLMMVDGQPQFAGIYSHHVADFYDTEYVERVEVLRGPGSVLYGSNAMGGVINVITKDAGARNGVRTTLSTRYGSYNTWRSSATNTVRLNRFTSLVSLGYDRTDGVQEHFDFKQKNLYAKAGYEFSDAWKAVADYSLMNFVGNDPVYPKLSRPESTDIYHQNVTRGEASLALHNRYVATDGSVRVYYSYGNHYVDDPNHFHSLDDRFGVLAYQNFRPWKGAAATLGFDFDTYTGRIPMSGGHVLGDGSMAAQMQTMSRKSVTEYSPYATLSQDLLGGRLVLNAGLRVACGDRFGTHWVPQGGFVLRPAAGWMLKASVAQGYRNPSFREMYLYRMANPDLDPERMTNYEVTVGKRFAHRFGLEVTAYYSQGDNLIQTVDNKNVNTGSFINKGIEISADGKIADGLTLRASYSYLHTSLDGLTAAPKKQYYIGAGWQISPRFAVDAELRGTGSLYVADDVARQDYALLNTKFTYRPCRLLELSLSLDNVTNARYTVNRGYEMPGFTAAGGVKLHF